MADCPGVAMYSSSVTGSRLSTTPRMRCSRSRFGSTDFWYVSADVKSSFQDCWRFLIEEAVSRSRYLCIPSTICAARSPSAVNGWVSGSGSAAAGHTARRTIATADETRTADMGVPSHDAVLRPAFEEGDDVVHDAGVEQLHPLRRLVGVVRRQHDLFAGQQRVPRRHRLDLEHVDAGPAEMTGVQRGRQGG